MTSRVKLNLGFSSTSRWDHFPFLLHLSSLCTSHHLCSEKYSLQLDFTAPSSSQGRYEACSGYAINILLMCAEKCPAGPEQSRVFCCAPPWYQISILWGHHHQYADQAAKKGEILSNESVASPKAHQYFKEIPITLLEKSEIKMFL